MRYKMQTLFESNSPEIISDPRSLWAPLKRPLGYLVGIMAAALVVNLLTFTPVYAQLQNSGGLSIAGNVTVVQGTGSNLHVVVDTAPTTAVTGTFYQATQPVSIATAPALVASTALIGYTRAQNACGTTNYESGMQMLPSASTSLTATTTCVAYIILNNTTGSAVTVTVQDQTTACNSAPCQVLSAFSIPANSNLMLTMQGSKFASGIKWNAGSANAIVADVLGNQ